jgi:rubrerythrin
MKFNLTADEVFEIAEQIERNGAAFYYKASQIAQNELANQLMLTLAKKEEEHEVTFAMLRKHLADDRFGAEIIEPGSDVEKYLHTLANTRVFDARRKASDILTGSESLEQILQTAIQFEKDSILYYLGLKNVVRNGNDKEHINTIIYEEVSHISDLSTLLRNLSF